MRKLPIILCLALVAALRAFAAATTAFYKLGPDSLPQDGVPKGKPIGPLHLPSRLFQLHAHLLDLCARQYDPKEPAGLMIFQDGSAMIATNGDMRVPNVLDNLIWRREIPVPSLYSSARPSPADSRSLRPRTGHAAACVRRNTTK